MKALRAVIVSAAIVALGGCELFPTISQNATTVSVSPGTLTWMHSQGIQDLEGPSPTRCLGIGAEFDDHVALWNALAGTPLREPGVSIVGHRFDIISGMEGNVPCGSILRLDHRAGFTYDVASLVARRDVIARATVTFEVTALPPGVGTPQCRPLTGAAAQLQMLPPGQYLPDQSAGFFRNADRDRFANHPVVFQLPAPWADNAVLGPNGTVTTSIAGGDKARFTVDVTQQIVTLLNRAATDATLAPIASFVITGAAENDPLQPAPPSEIDCRTGYRAGSLVVQHF